MLERSAPRTVGGREAVGVLAGITILGVAFSSLRVRVGLDHATYAVALAAFIGLLLVALVAARATRLSRTELGMTRPAALPMVLGVGMSSVVLIGAALLTGPVTQVPAWTSVVAGLVFFSVGTAPAEELLFRGVLYAMVERRFGAVAAVTTTAVSFALAHVPVYGWSSFGIAICAGLVFGWLRWWTASLAAPVAAHVVADMALLWL